MPGTPASRSLFPRAARILRSADYRSVYDHGFRVSHPLLAAFCLARTGAQAREESEEAGARLGITVPRAVGKAVLRNRIKRRLREAFRLHRQEIGGAWDIVINPRRTLAEATFAEVEQALGKVIARCNSHS